ncbi:MAG TPA: DMT family transporter [Jatrophihabitantaceae bacterium]
MSSPGNAATGVGLALLSAATFGTSGSFATALLDAGWTPDAVVIARISIAAALLAAPAAVALRRASATLRAATAPTLVYGVAAVGGAQVCFFNAVKYVPVGVALLLEYLGIALVVGWMWLRHRQPPRRLTVAGMAVVLVGLSFVLDLFGSTHVNVLGVLWGLGAAVGLAAYFVLSAHSTDRLPPIAMACAGLAVAAVALTAVGVIGILPLHATFGTVRLVHHQVSWLVPIAGLSILAAAIAYVAGIHAARRLGPKLASFVGLTEVLFAVLFAWFLLGQLPSAVQGIGAVLVITGIVLVRLDESAEVPEQPRDRMRSHGTAPEPAVEPA